jgi:hypothetical protein
MGGEPEEGNAESSVLLRERLDRRASLCNMLGSYGKTTPKGTYRASLCWKTALYFTPPVVNSNGTSLPSRMAS